MYKLFKHIEDAYKKSVPEINKKEQTEEITTKTMLQYKITLSSSLNAKPLKSKTVANLQKAMLLADKWAKKHMDNANYHESFLLVIKREEK